MSEDERETEIVEEEEQPRLIVRRRYFTRRNAVFASAAAALLLVLVVLLAVVLYRTGVVNNYIKEQFTAKMADIGIVFSADVFQVAVNPLELELKNATFNDKVSGEKLFFIRDAHLKLTVQDLYAWQLSRDISIDRTEINGAEVWVKFDENGNSNFSNLKLVEDQAGSRVNFKYESVEFVMNDSNVHFGDLSRKMSGDAKNVTFLLNPAPSTPDNLRYNFDLTSTDSSFVYDNSTVDKIDIRAVGIGDHHGAEISKFELRTPVGESFLSGTLTDWADPRYEFDVQSTVDLTLASSILPIGSKLVGIGNFKGKVSGQGESYRIEGEADSQSLRADGVYLRGANINATVAGTNSSYEANGTAIAEMLTFDDFRIDFLKLAGNVRGTGTDFRWVGELQAAAAKTRALTIGGLFLSDAVADYRDKDLSLKAGSGRAQKFKVGDTEITGINGSNIGLSSSGGTTIFTAQAGRAAGLRVDEFGLQGVSARNIRVHDRGKLTQVDLEGVAANASTIGKSRLSNVHASKVELTDLPASTDLKISNMTADRATLDGNSVSGVTAPEMTVHNDRSGMVIYSDKLRIAKLDTDSAVLGSLNIGGVRLTVRNGRVEGRSGDINAGNVALKKSSSLPDGGSLQGVTAARPVFILEPSGRYRASADMSIGGGVLGSISLGAARAQVEASSGVISLRNLAADVMEGQLNGEAVLAMSGRNTSSFRGDFTNIDMAKLLALQGGRILPLEGQTSGNVDLQFQGTNFRTASGRLDATITANAGDGTRGQIPVNGQVRLSAVNGLFDVQQADLSTGATTLNATGRFDLRDQGSNLQVALRSTNASEIDRIVRVLNLSPELETQLDDLQVGLGGNLAFDGNVTGNLSDPIIAGKASVDSFSLRGRDLGRVTTDVAVSPAGIELQNGRLQQNGGGAATFALNIPYGGVNNTSIIADLNNVDIGNLLAALPIDLPAKIRDLSGLATGKVDIRGLPNNAQGSLDVRAANGMIAGQAFDGLAVKAVFNGTRVDLERAEMNIGAGRLSATGGFDRVSKDFAVTLTGKTIPLPLAVALIPNNESIPAVRGDVDFTARAAGVYDRPATYDVNFSGSSPQVLVADTSLGQVAFKGQTSNRVLTADLTASLDGNPQVINTTIDFGNDNLPFVLTTDFNQSPLAPFLAFVPQLRGMPITGTGTGRVQFGGNLATLDKSGNRVYSAENLTGTAEFSQLALQIQDTPLSAAEPVKISFNTKEIRFDRARFAGGGSNMTIAGTKALTDAGVNDLSIDGRVNLNLLNLVSKDTFFSGFADTSIRLTGPTARISGTANVINGSVATFLGSDRVTMDRVKARLIFTADQVEVEEAQGYLGGGRFTASGGGSLKGLAIQSFSVSLNGTNVTVPLPSDFITTGDAQLEITGIRREIDDVLRLTVSGRVYAKRSLYSKDIDLANIIGGRQNPVLSGGSGGGSIAAPRLDIVIEGRDALIVRNNVADLTASVSLSVTGDADNPRVAGRITATGGTIFFRKDRYNVQRAVLEFPPETEIDPVINLQAESEIAGYQVFVNLSGPLRDSELLTANVRSSPALPQADVVSLITTGNLTNTAGGIPTLAQTGINTAAEILTDAIINNPLRKATDKLFGLNVFEIDPIISGQQLNPSARLTVGRQINNNLKVTYSTNLSQDQQQVLAVEYRVSNKLSFVAQYEQRSLSNVTRNRDNFSFEVRFRKRF